MIRVLRLLEYSYPDVAAMERDMALWNIPANGTKGPLGVGRTIKSAVLPLTVLDVDPEPEDFNG